MIFLIAINNEINIYFISPYVVIFYSSLLISISFCITGIVFEYNKYFTFLLLVGWCVIFLIFINLNVYLNIDAYFKGSEYFEGKKIILSSSIFSVIFGLFYKLFFYFLKKVIIFIPIFVVIYGFFISLVLMYLSYKNIIFLPIYGSGFLLIFSLLSGGIFYLFINRIFIGVLCALFVILIIFFNSIDVLRSSNIDFAVIILLLIFSKIVFIIECFFLKKHKPWWILFFMIVSLSIIYFNKINVILLFIIIYNYFIVIFYKESRSHVPRM